MQATRKMEFWVGLMVLMALLAGLFMALRVSNFGKLAGLQDGDTYPITASFSDIGGLKPRSKVTMGGVVIGRVANIVLDRETFKAVVTLDIERSFTQIPVDSSASILTSGLLGDQYIGLEPGGEQANLVAGSKIEHTQPAMVLEKLIGQFLIKLTESNNNK
jgi:phospholipid/cholesterol/gamma-HCH transport system substrate-binding protein